MKFLAKEVSFGSTPSAIERRIPKSSPGTSFSKAPKVTWSPVCTLNEKYGSSHNRHRCRCNLAFKSRLRLNPTASSAFQLFEHLDQNSEPRFLWGSRIRQTDSFKRSSEMSPVSQHLPLHWQCSILGPNRLCCEGSLASRLNQLLLWWPSSQLPPHQDF